MAGRLCVVQSLKLCSVQNLSKAASVAVVIKRNSHDDAHDVVRGHHDNLAAYRRGKGGAASFSGVVATVFGATGFLGRYVVSRLGKIGCQVIIPYRGDPYNIRELKLAGEIGQILFLPFHLRDEDSIRQCMKHSNVVINLIGRDFETRNFKFDDVHVDGARRLARLARECGVEKFIHLSHLSAQPNPPAYVRKGGSQFLKSKYNGELAVLEEFPDATMIRSADIFGEEDRFLRYYGSRRRRLMGLFPMRWRAYDTVKRPVCNFDVAQGIVNIVNDPLSVGRTYEFYGPHAYHLYDLIEYFFHCMRWPRIYRVPINPVYKLKMAYHHRIRWWPDVGVDRLEREYVDEDIEYLPNLLDLGIKLTAIGEQAPYHLRLFRAYNAYYPKLGEMPDPDPPAPLPSL